ncbi:hypothetical protein Dsin_015183 [Dipteronia sinensis]|uniref:RRM domain-containing protein n=1 Tax=Dipteronia sinensis TaxID=43782 RepID=A0AAE0ABZ2_9ROSI|nr:hypothetical protein Dsin_015183 [Dipteronia sinensis]
MCLWGVFKSFGKVRDVFLAGVNRERRRGFAFVRFATLEEARRVAEMTNEMHLYGWPIEIKVALYGWSKRRSYGTREDGRLKADPWTNEDHNTGGQRKEENISKGKLRDNLSFAEVVKDYRWKPCDWKKEIIEELNKEQLSMTIDRKVSEHKWLEMCDIGVLKDFASVLRVFKRLSDRGLRFSSKYLGGKVILWSFESVNETKGFINNCFFWEDTFRSMEKWSERIQMQPKPIWINVAGLPLNYWNEAFFQRVGNLLGDLLLIEKDNLHKRRLDIGTLLISVPEDRRIPNKVKVTDGVKTFCITVEKEDFLTNLDWLVEELGLNFESKLKDLESISEKDDSYQARKGDKMDEVNIEKRVSFIKRKGDGKATEYGDKNNISNIWRDSQEGGFRDKGKRVHVRNLKRRPSQGTYGNKKLELEKKRDCKVRVVRSDSWLSSSESKMEGGQWVKSGRAIGECSKLDRQAFGPKNKATDGLNKTGCGKGQYRDSVDQSGSSEDRASCKERSIS